MNKDDSGTRKTPPPESAHPAYTGEPKGDGNDAIHAQPGDEEQAKRECRKAALKNLGGAGVWMLIIFALFVSGQLGHLYDICHWPERALRDSGLLSGKWEALIPLTGILGEMVFLGMTGGWLLLIPPALFMLLAGRRSNTLTRWCGRGFVDPPPQTRRPDRLSDALAVAQTGDHREAIQRLRAALKAKDPNALIRFHLSLELAETGDLRTAYLEMLRFLRDVEVSAFAPTPLFDAEVTGKRTARRWEKRLKNAVLTKIGRGRRLSVICPECGTRLKASLDTIDEVAVCAKCQTEFRLPFTDGDDPG